MKTKRSICIIVMALVFMVGCVGEKLTRDDIIQDSRTVLKLSRITYYSTLREIGVLYKMGAIDDAVRQDVIDIGRKFKDAHNLAVSAIRAFDKSGAVSDEAEFTAAFKESLKFYTEFMAVAVKYLGE